MTEPHRLIFQYEPEDTPDLSYDAWGKVDLRFIATDRSSVLIKMEPEMLKRLWARIGKALGAE
jgi:hypothetical protein